MNINAKQKFLNKAIHGLEKITPEYSMRLFLNNVINTYKMS